MTADDLARSLWEALGRDPAGFDGYVADHGWDRVLNDDLLPAVRRLVAVKEEQP